VKPTKRKSTAAPKSKSKKGKKVDPASVVAGYETGYGKMMFSQDGRFQLTPAESSQAGLLIQKQKWFLDKASSSWPVLYCRSPISLLVFTQAFVDGCRKDEQEIKDGGDVVEFVSLQAFVKLIDAVGKFCNFDKEFGVPLKLGIAFGQQV
jgi:hypothetical protein